MRPLSPVQSLSSTAVTCGLGSLCPLGEVGSRVGDLRLASADEEAEAVGGGVLLCGRETAERVEEVVLDDPAGAAERLEPGERERVLPGCDAVAPEPLEHELQEGRLDPVAGRLRTGALAAGRERQATARRRGEHRLDERRLDLERLLALGQRAVPGLDRPLDRLARGLEVEVVDADVVRKQRRDVPLEAVELRPGVLADREQDVHRQARVVDDPRQLGREARQALVVALVGVVLEVLLELVEDDEQRPGAAGPRAQRLGERCSRSRKRLRPGRAPATPTRAASRRPCTGSSRHDLNTQTANGLSSAAVRASSRRSWTAPAISSELLPTPLGP